MKEGIFMGGGARTAIADGRISATEYIECCLERISERESDVGAWAHLNPDYALEQAKICDASLKGGQLQGLLHGIPIGIKDIIDTRDYPTECGTQLLEGRNKTADAEVVRLLRSEGAIILGKTVTCELAFYGPGKTRNPRNLNRTPGGSSSGSAAAVADFHVPLALGTQTAGSIIRPASYCGVIGFKPTFGKISLAGVLYQSPPLDTLGCFARSIEDVRLILSVLFGKIINTNHAKKSAFRLAFLKTESWLSGDIEMHKAFEILLKNKSSLIEEKTISFCAPKIMDLQKQIQFRDIAIHYGPIVQEDEENISFKLREVIAEGRTVTLSQYQAARSHREPLYEALKPIFNDYDAILTPAAPGVAPMGLSSTGPPTFNFLWTYLGCPTISLPLLEIDGLPLGLQLVGARNEDEKLLETAENVMSQLSS
ncbi:MAG: amidase [Hyphomicrobium sp.]